MHNSKTLLHPSLLFIFLFVVTSCGGDTSGSSDEASSETKGSAPEESNTYPRTALGAIFQISDINKWIEVYQREVSDDVRIGTLQSMENPNLVFVMQWSENHNTAKDLAGSPETQDIMQEGTMTSDPQFRYYDVKYYNDDLSKESYRLAVTAEVLNYEMWRNDFDREESRRKEAGLSMIGLATDADNKNLVYILFSSDDQTKVYEFLSSEETKQAISDSGVIGEPNMTWWKLPGAVSVTR